MAVTSWPTYLLRGIPPDTRTRLSQRALDDDVSLADVVRQALCVRYRLDCDPESFGYQADRDQGSDVLILRLQPELYKLIKKQTRNRYGAVKTLILDTLTDYLEGAS